MPTPPLDEALHRLRTWPFPQYVMEGREWLYDADLAVALNAAEQHLKETTP